MSRPASVLRAMGRATLVSVALTGGLTLGVAAWARAPIGVDTLEAGPDPSPAASVEALVATHDCWSGPAPDPTQFPHHAVVTLPGERPALVSSEIGFEIWLDGRPGTLHAFCP